MRSSADGGLVIAVDGPSGSGKSSAARAVATRLGLRYVDTGAMYRAVTWWMLRAGVPVDDPDEVAARADEPVLTLSTDPGDPRIAVDGVDVSGPIRTREVSNAVSAVSAVPAVRARLVAEQRAVIGAGGAVVEGRDIGTVVAPDADVKIYLTADEQTRAERRAAELRADPVATVTTTQQEMARRDRLDSSRVASPLVRAPDAAEIDSTALGIDEVVRRILELAEQAVPAKRAT